MNSGDSMCAERWRRFASDHAGATLRKTPGPSPIPYQPTPKPSPFVGSAPMRACRLWSTMPCGASNSSVSSTSGCPSHAIQRHIASDLHRHRLGRRRRYDRLRRPEWLVGQLAREPGADEHEERRDEQCLLEGEDLLVGVQIE